MNDFGMGFKHAMLQRLQDFEVSPINKISPNSNEPALAQRVTDFSINRILGENAAGKTLRSSLRKTPSAVAETTLTKSDADILDLSKNSAESATTAATFPYAVSYHHAALQTDFLTAAAAANASKFYAHFFPHIFPTYMAASNLTLATPTLTSPYQKRYFAPYIVNSSNLSTSAFNNATAKPVCPRTDCTHCLDYYKQFSGKALSTSTLSATGSFSSSASSTYRAAHANYLKTKSPSELLLNSSSISLTTVANFNLTATKSTQIGSVVKSSTASTAPNSEEISYKCRICEKVFGCSQTLQAHEKTHKSPRYECTDCGKGFSQLRNYKYHLSVHRGTKEFAAECSECGKTFNDKGYLSSHMKIHRNKKEYECPYCPKSFNQRVAFNMHVRIHTGVKPHKCAECGKRFSRKMLLKQHMRTHSGEKPYQCSVCGKSFADRSNMTLHHRLHSGIKPFNCPICPKAFTKKHHLKTHLNYHTGCKPYVCPHPNCNQAFTQSSNMRTHAKKCQYRPLQLPFPVSSTAACSNASTATVGTTHGRVTSTMSSHLNPASTTLSAGMRMLNSVSATQSLPFPPAQQALLPTMRPF